MSVCRLVCFMGVCSGLYPVALGVSAVELLGLGLALHHRVDGLQVRRVGHEGEGDVAFRHTVDAPVVHAQVVLHISRALGPT